MKLKAICRREFITVTAILIVVSGTSACAEPLTQKASSVRGSGGYKGDVTDIRVVRRVEQHPDSWRLWQPFIIQGLKQTHLIVAFGAMTNGKKDMGDIFACVSKDDGDSWDEPVAVFDHNKRQGDIQFAYANPVLYRAEGQKVIWCYAMRCPISYENSEESQLVGAFTADSGRSWTPVEMAMHYTGPLITNSGIVETNINGQKRFLLPAHRNTLQKDPFGSRDHFILSSTSLLEWKLEAFIPQPKNGKVFLHEGNIAPGDAPGELKIVMRTAQYKDTSLTTDPPRAYSSVSKDGGHTWSPAKPEPELHNAKAKSFFGLSSDGTYIYVYNDGPAQRDIAPGFPNGGRTSLRYKTKPAGGKWSEEKTFFHAGIKNSYPTLIEVAPGDFRAVWDSGTADRSRTHIHFGKLRIKP
ncbi:MAG: exo-alpha-sialidase [Planctomycetes bacterium]|nr:exo-alpha-sialidase [Planctomycetota bacterium]